MIKKQSILLSTVTFIAGLSVGYFIWHTEPQKDLENSSTKIETPEFQAVSDTDHLKEISILKERIHQLEFASAVNQELPTPEEVDMKVRRNIVLSIINGEKDSPRQAELDYKNFLNKVKGLNLTPDQMSIAEQLWQKRMQQMRLIAQTRGLLNDDERKEQYPELYSFNFDFELNKVLADDQTIGYEEKKNQELAGVGNMMSAKFLSDYRISPDSGFSADDQALIQKAVAQAYTQNNGKLEIPEAIQELKLSPLDERVLASCYVELPQDLFEKIYRQMVKAETVTPWIRTKQ